MATGKKIFNGKSEIFHESFEFLMENGLKNDCFLIENVPGKLNRYEKWLKNCRRGYGLRKF